MNFFSEQMLLFRNLSDYQLTVEYIFRQIILFCKYQHQFTKEFHSN